MDDLLSASGTRLAALIRGRQVSSREVIEAHIARIERVNPVINALVATRFREARAEADAADRLLASAGDDLPPFLGVPCTIKEAIALTGMPHSAGLVARRDVRATRDATCVARLRRAGAIPLGVTNTSELCMWLESANKIYGRTNNPWDPARMAGGSSGGEGAVVAAGGSPFGLGADVGGSIRMPAFFNGVFGHKPTGGRLPNSGHYPPAQGAALRMLTLGPLCRRAEDLLPLLAVMAGPDGQDEQCRAMSLGDPAAVDLSALKVLDVRGNGFSKVSQDLLAAQDRAAKALAGLGARVEAASHPALKESFLIWGSTLDARDPKKFQVMLGEGKPINRPWQLLLWLLGRSPHTFPALGLSVVEELTRLAPGQAARAVAQGDALRRDLEEMLGPNGVMLFPSFTRPAPRHHWPILRPMDCAYTGIFNALEFPVTQVPLGLNEAGLPLGLQVAARRGKDHLCIGVALALERACGGWRLPAL